MKNLLLIFFSMIVLITPTRTYAVAPGVAGVASIIPGLGQAIQGAPFEAIGWFVTTVGLFSSRDSDVQQIGFDLWQYNMYDAYRDAGALPAQKHSVATNWLANWNPLNIWDPIGAPIVAVGAIQGARTGLTGLRSPRKVIVYSFVGLGEEGLFRGFLFPAFTDVFGGSTWAGAITSSAIFSFAHVTGGSANLGAGPLLQRFLMGMLFCWQVDRNHYDLRKSIFAHSWFDVFVDREATEILTPGIRWNLRF